MAGSTPVEPRSIETTNAIITLRPPGITWIEYRPGARDSLQDAEEHLAAQEELADGGSRPTLIDIRPMAGIDKEARDLYAGPRANGVNAATALVVKSRISRVIGSFFIGLNKPGRPTRMFTSTDKAVAWLETFL